MTKNRRRDESGAALVESAIVLVPLCIIIFGIIEFGFIFKDSLSISNASRAGARVASAEPAQTDPPGVGSFYTDTINAVTTAGTAASFSAGSKPDHLWIYDADDNPSGGPGVGTCGTDCSQYKWGGSGWVADGGHQWSQTARATEDCLGGNMASVGVKLQVAHHSITGFFGNLNGLQLTERTVMRLEPQQSSC